MGGGDEVADPGFRGGAKGAGGLARFRIVAARALDDEATGGGGIGGVAVEDAGVEAGLVAKGGVEAGWVDAEGFGDLRDADGVVAAGVEEVLGGGDGLVGVEAAWPATGAG